MSSENVEIVRRAFEAATRTPAPDYRTLNELFDRDHEFISRLSRLDGRTYRGAAGFRDWQTELAGTFEISNWAFVEASAIDAERVLLALCWSAHGRVGEVPFDELVWEIATVRDGLVVRTEAFSSREAALAAAA